MKIGSLDIGSKLILAPMAEVTDAPFRKMAKKFGAGFIFTQMVSARGVIENNFETLKLLTYGQDEKPLGVQLLVNRPEVAYRAVKDLLARKPDLIDLNCGCPIDKVTRHNLGSKLLDDPPLIGKLIESMKKAAGDIPVSVKLRIGRDRRKVNILETVKVAEDNGASLVFVHGRARSDRYDTEPDWNILADVAAKTKIPVIGNGSVFEAEDAIKMKQETGVASILVARGALGNPFLFDRYNKWMETGKDPGKPSLNLVYKSAVEHINLIKFEQNNTAGLNNAKKNLFWYFKYFNGVFSLIENVMRVNSFEDVLDVLQNHVIKIESGNVPEDDFSEVRRRFKHKVLFWLID